MKYQLIDEICLQDWAKTVGVFVPDVREIAGAQVFCVNNVDHFFWANFDKYRDSGAFPNYAPPFDSFFMYCDDTRMTCTDGPGLYRDLFPQYRYGFWFLPVPIMDTFDDMATEWFTSCGTNRLILKNAGVRWLVKAIWFTSYSKSSIDAPIIYQYLVNEDGTFGELGWDSVSNAIANEQISRVYGMTSEQYGNELFKLGMTNLAVCHLATSLLHCKNVAAVDAEPTAKERYRMAEYERKHRSPAAKWKVLTIEPMVRTLRTQGAIESNGLSKALHICRGHFKDYSQGKGLFGKAKGLYWWDQHMRGDESNGVIIKDYDIKPGGRYVA